MKQRIFDALTGGGLGALLGAGLLWLLASPALNAAATAAVERICSASPSERGVLRERVDRITAPHTIRVTCADSILLDTDSEPQATN